MASIDLATVSENVQANIGLLNNGKYNNKEILLDIFDALIIITKQIRYALNNLDGSNMPTIKSSLDGLVTKIEAINGDITTIKHTGAEISEQIESQKVRIGDEVLRLSELIDQKTKEIDERYKGKISVIEDSVSKVTKTADEINSTVKKNITEFKEGIADVKQLINAETGKLDSKLGGQIKQITEQQSEISQKADKIESTVTESIRENRNYLDRELANIPNLISRETTSIKQTARNIELKYEGINSSISGIRSDLNKKLDEKDFSGRQIISKINLDANGAVIQGDRIKLEGRINEIVSPDGRSRLTIGIDNYDNLPVLKYEVSEHPAFTGGSDISMRVFQKPFEIKLRKNSSYPVFSTMVLQPDLLELEGRGERTVINGRVELGRNGGVSIETRNFDIAGRPFESYLGGRYY